ncbi:MAG TPA: hypothetical protein CFH78_05970, partial [Sulfurimonas sp. UBA10385]
MENKYNDSLTGISNRFALMEYLQNVQHANLFLIDIDNFSNINGAYGFEMGDIALVEIARLLEVAKPFNCELFRINSDEFVLVSLSVLSHNSLSEAASSMVSFFDHTEIHISNNIYIKVSISIGISIGHGNELFKHAKKHIKELREH